MALARSKKSLPDQVKQKLLAWSEHVLSWVNASELNCHVIRYEDMLHKPIETFTQACHFLQLPTEAERIEKAIRFSEFKVLSEQEAIKGFQERSPKAERFFRQGKTGGWRDNLTDEQIKKIIDDHHQVMLRFGYLDEYGNPL